MASVANARRLQGAALISCPLHTLCRAHLDQPPAFSGVIHTGICICETPLPRARKVRKTFEGAMWVIE